MSAVGEEPDSTWDENTAMDKLLDALESADLETCVARIAGNTDLSKFERAMWIMVVKKLDSIETLVADHIKSEEQWQKDVNLFINGNGKRGMKDLLPLVSELQAAMETRRALLQLKYWLIAVGTILGLYWALVSGAWVEVQHTVIRLIGGTPPVK